MSDKNKIRIVVDEDPDIVARIDAIAELEAISRSDVLRRAIRRLLFSMPSVPTIENFPKPTEPADVTA